MTDLRNTNEKIRHVLSQIFSPNFTGKEMKITIADEGPRPKRGRRYIAIFKYPRFGLLSKEEIPRTVEEWRRKVEKYLIHANHVWYRTTTKNGSSKLYLLHDENL